MDKTDVAILGCTGAVGQRFLELLENHPMFNVKEICASDNSKGKTLEETGKIIGKVPQYAKKMKIKSVNDDIESIICFSALPPDTAKKVEWDLVKKGKLVISKAKTNRYEEDVPILIPEINADQLDLYIKRQKQKRKLKGFLITDPNCTTIGLALTLKPLIQFGINEIQMVSMQALSGGGYEALTNKKLKENVIPFISGEEEKVVLESRKILGTPNLNIFATCNRVHVIDGHTETVHIKFDHEINVAQVKQAMKNFTAEPQKLKLPSAPNPVIVVTEENDRPQPEVDRNNGKGMAVTVGRIRKGIDNSSIAYTLVSHNTVRGAAGASILDAEYLVKTGKINEMIK